MNHFLLTEEEWIPIVGRGRVSLKTVFTDQTCKAIDGNPIQKLAIYKLLFCIAESAYMFEDENEWEAMSLEQYSDCIIAYLNEHQNQFYLYGEKPFLQFPQLLNQITSEIQKRSLYIDYFPDLPGDNASILKQNQKGHLLSDAEKAVFLITLMNYALGGERIAKIPCLSETAQYEKIAKAGPSLGKKGNLSFMFLGDSVLDTVHLNHWTKKQILLMNPNENLTIRPLWEEMPTGEEDSRAIEYKKSHLSWYLALSRFVLFDLVLEDKMIYARGLIHPVSIKEGWFEPYLSIDKKKNEAKCCDISKKPWREIPALLETILDESSTSYSCAALSLLGERIRKKQQTISVWSGGLTVQCQGKEQYIKANDDYIESEVQIESECLDDFFFTKLREGMCFLDQCSKILYSAVKGYCKELNLSRKNVEQKAEEHFWLLAESLFSILISLASDNTVNNLDSFKKKGWHLLQETYDEYCPKDSARQLEFWIKYKPNKGGNK